MELQNENPLLYGIQQNLFAESMPIKLTDCDHENNEIDFCWSAKRGAMSEMRFMEYAWKHGYECAENKGSSTWDIAISKPRHALLRVQVKTFQKHPGTGAGLCFVLRGRHDMKNMYIRGDYDILAIYDSDRDLWHFSDFVTTGRVYIYHHKYAGINELHRLYNYLSAPPVVINHITSPL